MRPLEKRTVRIDRFCTSTPWDGIIDSCLRTNNSP
nr:MAG TPA: hypothetical protein [Caudoviricetes sp.]